MILNINELRHISNLEIKVGENYILSLSASTDGQSLRITTSQTNTCCDECCSYGDTDKNYAKFKPEDLKVTAVNPQIKELFKHNLNHGK